MHTKKKSKKLGIKTSKMAASILTPPVPGVKLLAIKEYDTP